MKSIKRMRTFLRIAGILERDDDRRDVDLLLTNDTWGWALAWLDIPTDAQIPAIYHLFRDYGWCGVYYWVSEQNHQMRSEFEDINRFVDFVRKEEQIKREMPDSNKRAYWKYPYTLGGEKQ